MQKETNYITKEDMFDVLRRIEIVLTRVNGKNFFTQFLRQIVEQIKKLPAADVRPVVKATWKRIDYKPCGHDYKCSSCGWKNDMKTRFCPNCGAEMSDSQTLEDAAQDADCGAMAPAT